MSVTNIRIINLVFEENIFWEGKDFITILSNLNTIFVKNYQQSISLLRNIIEPADHIPKVTVLSGGNPLLMDLHFIQIAQKWKREQE